VFEHVGDGILHDTEDIDIDRGGSIEGITSQVLGGFALMNDEDHVGEQEDEEDAESQGEEDSELLWRKFFIGKK
jgi:hypothetical protein